MKSLLLLVLTRPRCRVPAKVSEKAQWRSSSVSTSTHAEPHEVRSSSLTIVKIDPAQTDGA